MIRNFRNILNRGGERSRTLKKNILALFLLKFVSVAISFMLVPATIGYVSSELYGVWLTISSVLICIQFFDIGLTQGLKNKLTEAIALEQWDRAKRLISTTYAVMIAIFLPIALILEIVVPYVDWTGLLNISSAYAHQINLAIQVMLLFVCLQMTVNVIVSVVSAFQKVAFSQMFTVIGNLVAFLLILLFTRYTQPSLILLILALAGAPILVTAVASVILFRGRYASVAPSARYITPAFIKDLFSLGIKFFIINLQAVVVFQTTNFLISYVSSPESVTSYNIAYKYLGLTIFIFANFMSSLWPAYTDAYTKGDYDWMISTKRKMDRILLCCCVFCVLAAACAQPVYSIWIGDKAYIPPMMTWSVSAYIMAYCYMTLNGTLIIGVGKVQLETLVVTIGMILYIPMALCLSGIFHEYGILASLVIVNLCYAIIFNIQSVKILNRTATGIWDK